MSPGPGAPLHVLFASAAKHGMDHAIQYRRIAQRAREREHAAECARLAEAWRLAAWDHLDAAREAKRTAA